MSLARHLHYRRHLERAPLQLRVLIGVLVLVALGASIGWLLGMSLVKGFDFLHVSELGGTQLSGK